MNRNESRYFATAKKMDDALVELLQEKPLEYVTVKEICQRAGVNRSTFYLHYQTIGDLLAECVEGANAAFLSYFEHDERSQDFAARIGTAPLEELVLVKPDFLVPYLSFVRDNRAVFAAAFTSPEAMESAAKFEGLYRNILEPILDRFGYPVDERRYAISFYIKGIMAIIQDWAEAGCAEPVEKIADVIEHCVCSEMGMGGR